MTLFRPSYTRAVAICSQYSTNSTVIQASIDNVKFILPTFAKFSSLSVYRMGPFAVFLFYEVIAEVSPAQVRRL